MNRKEEAAYWRGYHDCRKHMKQTSDYQRGYEDGFERTIELIDENFKQSRLARIKKFITKHLHNLK